MDIRDENRFRGEILLPRGAGDESPLAAEYERLKRRVGLFPFSFCDQDRFPACVNLNFMRTFFYKSSQFKFEDLL